MFFKLIEIVLSEDVTALIPEEIPLWVMEARTDEAASVSSASVAYLACAIYDLRGTTVEGDEIVWPPHSLQDPPPLQHDALKDRAIIIRQFPHSWVKRLSDEFLKRAGITEEEEGN